MRSFLCVAEEHRVVGSFEAHDNIY